MEPEREPPPPILGTWRRLYALVLGVLAALIGALTLLTWYYR